MFYLMWEITCQWLLQFIHLENEKEKIEVPREVRSKRPLLMVKTIHTFRKLQLRAMAWIVITWSESVILELYSHVLDILDEIK